MEDDLVSVLMPVKNGLPFLTEAVGSLLAQDHVKWELVLVDDGSTDGSAEVARRLAGDRLRLVHHERSLGVAQSLNDGLEACSGRYVARLDADDRSLPTRFSAQLAQLRHSKAGVVLSWYQNIDPSGRRMFTPDLEAPLSGSDLYHVLLLSNPLCHPTAMFDRTRVDVRYPVDQRYEDYALWLRMAEANTVKLQREKLVERRLHTSNVTATADTTAYDELVPIYVEVSGGGGLDVDPLVARQILWPDHVDSVALASSLIEHQKHVADRCQGRSARRLARTSVVRWMLRALFHRPPADVRRHLVTELARMPISTVRNVVETLIRTGQRRIRASR